MTTQLTKYEAARNALQVARTVDEVKDIRDKAEAMAAYARQAHDTELIKWATEIKVRAERRAGQMLAEMPKASGAKGVGPIAVTSCDRNQPPTLADIGVTKNESSRWQKLAAVSDEQFESAVAAAKDVAGEVTTAAMMRAAKASEPEKSAAVQKPRKPDPGPAPAPEEPQEPEYTPLDEAMDTIKDLQDALAIANAGDLSECDRSQAADLIARLREEVRILTLKLQAVTASRDHYQTENGELKKQITRQRREIDKLAGTRTA